MGCEAARGGREGGREGAEYLSPLSAFSLLCMSAFPYFWLDFCTLWSENSECVVPPFSWDVASPPLQYLWRWIFRAWIQNLETESTFWGLHPPWQFMERGKKSSKGSVLISGLLCCRQFHSNAIFKHARTDTGVTVHVRMVMLGGSCEREWKQE